MAANNKPRQYVQAGAAMVTQEVQAIILEIARQDDRPVAYVIRKLIEDSPRLKLALKNGLKKKRK